MAIRIDPGKCTGCGECRDICPMESIVVKDGKAKVGDTCVECGACVNQCPNKAISL